MRPTGLCMARKHLKFIKVSRHDVVMLELHPFLTTSHAGRFDRNWFLPHHMQEVEDLLRPVLTQSEVWDSRTLKDKGLKKLSQSCLLGPTVRLGFTLKQKTERQSLLNRSATAGYQCRGIQSVKVVAYVCPRLQGTMNALSSAFGKLLPSGDRANHGHISSYFAPASSATATGHTTTITTTTTSSAPTVSCFSHSEAVTSSTDSMKTESCAVTVRTDTCRDSMKTESCAESVRTDTCRDSMKTESCAESVRTDTCRDSMKTESCAATVRTDTCRDSMKTESCVGSVRTDTCRDSMKTESCAATVRTDTCRDSMKTESCAATVRTDTCRDSMKTESCVESVRTDTCRDSMKTESCVESVRTDTCRDSMKTESCAESVRTDTCRDSMKTESCVGSVRRDTCTDSKRAAHSPDTVTHHGRLKRGEVKHSRLSRKTLQAGVRDAVSTRGQGKDLNTASSITRERKEDFNTAPTIIRESRKDLNTSPSITKESRKDLNTASNTTRKSIKDLNTCPSITKERRKDHNTAPIITKESIKGLNAAHTITKKSRRDLNTASNTTKESIKDLNTSPGITKESRTNLNTSSGNNRESRTDLNTSSGNNRESRTNLNTSSGNNRESRTDLNTSSGNNRESRTDLNTSSSNNKESRTDLNTSSGNNRESRTDLNTSSGNNRESRTDLNTSSGNNRESRTDLNTSSGNNRESRTDLKTSSSNNRESRTDLKTSSGNNRESRTDLNTSSSNNRESRTDLKTSSSNNRESRTDLNTSSGNNRESRTDLNTSSGNNRESRQGLSTAPCVTGKNRKDLNTTRSTRESRKNHHTSASSRLKRREERGRGADTARTKGGDLTSDPDRTRAAAALEQSGKQRSSESGPGHSERSLEVGELEPPKKRRRRSEPDSADSQGELALWSDDVQESTDEAQTTTAGRKKSSSHTNPVHDPEGLQDWELPNLTDSVPQTMPHLDFELPSLTDNLPQGLPHPDPELPNLTDSVPQGLPCHDREMPNLLEAVPRALHHAAAQGHKDKLSLSRSRGSHHCESEKVTICRQGRGIRKQRSEAPDCDRQVKCCDDQSRVNTSKKSSDLTSDRGDQSKELLSPEQSAQKTCSPPFHRGVKTKKGAVCVNGVKDLTNQRGEFSHGGKGLLAERRNSAKSRGISKEQTSSDSEDSRHHRNKIQRLCSALHYQTEVVRQAWGQGKVTKWGSCQPGSGSPGLSSVHRSLSVCPSSHAGDTERKCSSPTRQCSGTLHSPSSSCDFLSSLTEIAPSSVGTSQSHSPSCSSDCLTSLTGSHLSSSDTDHSPCCPDTSARRLHQRRPSSRLHSPVSTLVNTRSSSSMSEDSDPRNSRVRGQESSASSADHYGRLQHGGHHHVTKNEYRSPATKRCKSGDRCLSPLTRHQGNISPQTSCKSGSATSHDPDKVNNSRSSTSCSPREHSVPSHMTRRAKKSSSGTRPQPPPPSPDHPDSPRQSSRKLGSVGTPKTTGTQRRCPNSPLTADTQPGSPNIPKASGTHLGLSPCKRSVMDAHCRSVSACQQSKRCSGSEDSCSDDWLPSLSEPDSSDCLPLCAHSATRGELPDLRPATDSPQTASADSLLVMKAVDRRSSPSADRDSSAHRERLSVSEDRPVRDGKRRLPHRPQSPEHPVLKRRRKASGERSPLTSLSNSIMGSEEDRTSSEGCQVRLSEQEVRKLVVSFRSELMAIHQGSLHSHRHHSYMQGGRARRNLDYTSNLQYFASGQEDAVMDVLMTLFPNLQMKDLDYILRVLLPECLSRIYRHVTGKILA